MVPVRREDLHWPPHVPKRVDVVVGHLGVVEDGVGAHFQDLLALEVVLQLAVGEGGTSEPLVVVIGRLQTKRLVGVGHRRSLTNF